MQNHNFIADSSNGKFQNININNIKILLWNIEGYKSRLLGNKLVSEEFLSMAHKQDIVCLVETHACDQSRQMSVHTRRSKSTFWFDCSKYAGVITVNLLVECE